MQPIISHIVAASENGVIGKAGGMPWHLPADFRFFKKTTMGKAMIMGRKTFDSIGKPLPGRLSIVISRDPDYAPPGTVVVPSIAAALAHATEQSATWGDEIFIIGGGEIFRQTFDDVERIYLTRVHRDIEGDVYYPVVDLQQFKVVTETPGEGEIPFTWLLLERI